MWFLINQGIMTIPNGISQLPKLKMLYVGWNQLDNFPVVCRSNNFSLLLIIRAGSHYLP